MAELLPEPGRRRYLSGNRVPGYLNYWNPNGVHRADASTEDGERIEGSAVHLARQFFDSYKIEFSILNPEKILSIGLSPEPDHAAAKASAIIDSGYRLTGAFRYFSISDDCSKLVGR